jgi:hypothetical protein
MPPLRLRKISNYKHPQRSLARFLAEKETFTFQPRTQSPGQATVFIYHEPTRHCVLSLEALSPAKKQALEQDLTKKASSGQPITLHGEFLPLKDREGTAKQHVAFEVKE